ncbi:MAG TPA: flagellar motor switch protein FliM [Steroidobacteraceae bacterium]|nr:flagellar motor switch protein FliM [Steroidobacteraceae bacterium]
MSGEAFEQDEIDALLQAVHSGTVDTEPKAADGSGVVKDYDFSSQTRIVRGRMPTLEMINERLARALRQSLYGMLRRSPDVAAQGISTPKYSEYIPTLSMPTSLNLIRFLPLTGTGLLVFEARLVFAMIDVFFGGTGRQAKIEGRDFTPTETHLIEMLMEQVITVTQEAWLALLPVKIEFINREMNPHFANIVSPTEIVVVSRFRIDLDGRGGEIHLVLPYSMLEPMKDTLRAGMQSDRADREERWSQILRNELEESEVDVVTQLGRAHTTVGKLIDMRPGDVIPIEFDGQVAVLSDGIPLFWGELGQQRGRQVVRVAQMNARKNGNSLDAFVRKAT